ncbi:MAG: glycosyltransferase family A protein [Candidatus Bathyarchaeia archaeon]|jgi:glycosyltransferase involved in cell wall biosynthesis
MMDSVDVVLLTKNSERKLKDCLESVYRNVPVARLIVVDGYSTDKTLEIADWFNEKYHNVKVILDKGNRATARQKGIAEVKTEWFLFVDSDVVLCHDWFKKAQQYITADVGLVWGTEVWSTIGSPLAMKIFLVLTRKIFEVRGGTHDTLIKTELVKDIDIPKKLHVYEDAYIKDWVESKGFRAVPCYVPFCIHYRPPNVWTFRGSVGLMSEALTLGDSRVIGKLLAAYAFYSGYALYQVGLQGRQH